MRLCEPAYVKEPFWHMLARQNTDRQIIRQTGQSARQTDRRVDIDGVIDSNRKKQTYN